MPQRYLADRQELQDYYNSPQFEKLKKQLFTDLTENNMEKKQPDFNDQPYKTDGEGNELSVHDCVNRHERRKMKKMEKKNRRR